MKYHIFQGITSNISNISDIVDSWFENPAYNLSIRVKEHMGWIDMLVDTIIETGNHEKYTYNIARNKNKKSRNVKDVVSGNILELFSFY